MNQTSVITIYGLVIRYYRERVGRTRDDVANAIMDDSITDQWLTGVETGSTIINLDQIYKLSGEIGIDITIVFTLVSKLRILMECNKIRVSHTILPVREDILYRLSKTRVVDKKRVESPRAETIIKLLEEQRLLTSSLLP